MLIPSYVKVVAALSALTVAAFLIHQHGRAEADAEWQAEWNARDSRDETARADSEKRERLLEQTRRESNEKISADNQLKLDNIKAELATANSKSNGLQQQADRLVRQIGSGKSSLDSCVASASSAAEKSARVLADLFAMADQTAGTMAEIADQARIRGLACEATYRSLTPNGNY